ncbi:MAG: three-Cys-motif partner protein TcmP [Nocardioides sp.]
MALLLEGLWAIREHTMAREWHYWSLNKLEILQGYLPAFNTASQSVSERIYLDLMAGQPENAEAGTGRMVDGSARIALAAQPGFTRFAFGELQHAALLEDDLRRLHPDKGFRVYPGDCNDTIRAMLLDLDDVRYAPTFAFLDQQGAEVHWTTMAEIAAFRRGRTKAEQWILCSPTMIYRGLTGTNGDLFGARVDRMYGTDEWRAIYRARYDERIDAEAWRREMVNLLRWRLETELGYQHTARIPMRMVTNVEIYDMVFATDHPAGFKIMSHLYEKAAEREPGMRQEALDRAKPPLYADDALFDLPAEEVPPWSAEKCWDPRSTTWWPSS